MNASEQAVMSAVKRTFPVTVMLTRPGGGAVRLQLVSGPEPPALVGTAIEEGVVSPSADPVDSRSKKR